MDFEKKLEHFVNENLAMPPDADDLRDFVFFHGKESGPHGRKYQALRQVDPYTLSPDFQGMDLTQRVKLGVESLSSFNKYVLVGSSMGGLVAALTYQEIVKEDFNQIGALVLMAPALHWPEAQGIKVMPETVIIHGIQDDIVPIEASRAFAQRFGCTLIEVEDDHRLGQHAELMVKEAQKLHKQYCQSPFQ